ncbi:MAG TPA: aldo/keto reductase [Sphaerochaeta sp.]|jgi:aryl-alcohol dehydrogenase-like predicted oxidoreductase|nr:aldo/keto reductase [Spirochaetales bacterium]HKM05989.1 aldo/keto reductase [Sphaerochaeta sp.]
MHKRPFGPDKKMVSEVGLGTWQIGGSWGTVEDKTAMEILRTATQAGITFFDTADVYGDGRSERFIGKFLKDHPEKVFVATKLGRGSSPGWPQNFTPEAMIKHTENSLSRLGLERIDLIQLHCIPKEVLADGAVFDVLRELKSQGKIADFGASVETVDEGLICLKEKGIASLQVIFNIYRQKLITDLFDKAKQQQVSIIARVPLASGLLSGKMKKSTTFAATDHRNFNRDGAAFNVGETFAGLPFEKGVELTEELAGFKPEGMTLAQMALRWILDHEAVSVVIPGASRPAQVLDNAAISDLSPLSSELHKKLETFYKEKVAQHIRGPY